jgi:hypothetical protein
MPELLSPAQRRTLPAREALARRFDSPEEKRQHYRAMAEKANAGRVVLSADEATAVVEAYGLLGSIAERARVKLGRAPEPDESGAASPDEAAA